MKDFGIRLREYRGQRGWSRINLAMFTNISPSTLKSWELGLRVPEIEKQKELFEQMDTLGLPDKPEVVKFHAVGHSVNGVVEWPKDGV